MKRGAQGKWQKKQKRDSEEQVQAKTNGSGPGGRSAEKHRFVATELQNVLIVKHLNCGETMRRACECQVCNTQINRKD
jgi:hypothetical protein